MGNGFRKLNKRGLGIFFTAAFIGLAVMVVSFFLDTEAVFNRKIGENLSGGASLGLSGQANATIQADEVLLSLKCPMVITSKDQAAITANVSNSLDKDAIRIFEMEITDGYTKNKTKQILEMSPGGSETLSWEVSSNNAMYGFLILARGFLHPYASLPSLGGTCGILALDIPFLTGGQLLWGIIGLCFTGLLVGAILFVRANQPLTPKRMKSFRALIIVAGVVAAGLLLISLEFWYATFIITMVTILLVPAVYLHLVVHN